MKPRILKMQAFGPYPNMEIVDFTRFEKDGLFLICGETGSGKTMILDAITYALYGKSSTNLRDVFEDLRCKQCDENTPTIVDLEIEVQGEIYRFERKIERKRKNLSTTQNVYYKNEEGVFEPVFENCKKNDVERKATELIGLDFNQFRQVVILPQGQFEKLLTSESNEKEAILVKIFGVTKWQEIADIFYAKAEKRKNELNDIKRQIDDKLAEYECTNVNELQVKIDELTSEIKNNQEAFERENYSSKKTFLQEQRLLAKDFQTLKDLKKNKDVLVSQESVQTDRINSLNIIKNANELREIINQGEQAKKNSSEREKRMQDNEKNLSEISTQVENVSQKLSMHKSKEQDIQLLKDKVEELKAKKTSYERYETLRQEQITLEAAYNNSNNKAISLKNKLDKAKEDFSKISNNYIDLQKAHAQLLEKYIMEIAGSLAKDLKDGQECPVCGSVNHPKKAKAEEGAVSKEEVDKKKAEMDAEYTKVGIQDKTLKEVEEEYKDACRVATENSIKYENTKNQLDKEKKNLYEDINSLQDLEKEIKKCNSKIDDYNLDLEKLNKELNDVKEKRASIEVAVELTKQEYLDASNNLKTIIENIEVKVKQKGFSDVHQAKGNMCTDAEVDKLVVAIEKYKNNVETITNNILDKEKELEGKVEPDIHKCDEELSLIENAEKKFNANNAVNNDKLLRMKKRLEAIKIIENKYNKNWNQIESDFVFAKKLRGDTGISLQRYVLAVMFSCVISAANVMLENVHGGRYRLYRTDESSKGTNKKGLELGVFDSYSNERRSVKTLSGGEKFLVSLALSIGLSTVAGRSGIHLDAMFIDEGFGSLDEDSINDAMDILMGIKKSNGLVGIISHVQVMRDNIQAKIETSKSREGSTLIQNV